MSAEDRLRKLNRTYSLLSEVHRIITLTHEPKVLFETACRIAVDRGGFRMAWIGLLDPTTLQVSPVAQAGEAEGLQAQMRFTLDDSEHGLAAAVLRSGAPVVINDLAHDPRTTHWRTDALRMDYRALAIFPVIIEGHVRGTFGLYASEANFFDADELKLLNEMALDFAFALGLAEQETRRKEAEGALRESEERFAKAFHQSPIAIVLTDSSNDTIRDVNDSLVEMMRLQREHLVGQTVDQLHIQIDPEVRVAIRDELRSNGQFRNKEMRLQMPDGETRYILNSGAYISIGGRQHSLVMLQDITERKHMEQSLRESEEKLRLFIEHAPAALAMFDRDMRYIAVSRRWRTDYSLGEMELIGQSHYTIFPEIPERWKSVHALGLTGQVFQEESDHFPRADGTVQWLRWEVRPWYTADNVIGGLIIMAEDITRHKGAEAQIQYLASLIENVSDAIISSDLNFKIRSWNKAAEAIYGWEAQEVIGRTVSEAIPTQYHNAEGDQVIEQFRAQGFWKGDVIQTRKDGTPLDIFSAVAMIHDEAGNPSGSVAVNRNVTERRQAERRIRNQLQRLRALRTIDEAITSTLDLRQTLHVLLEQVSTQLHVDATSVLLLNEPMQQLEYAAGHGFNSPAIRHTQLRMGEGYAGQAALERRTVHVADLNQIGTQYVRARLLEQEHFISYFGTPLISKGQVKGVLEIFHRTPLTADPEWLEFLEALAGQAAIAIDNAQLFDELQRTNTQLRLAYDATIEGWSRALDLRDSGTEGHTQRVTELTVRLARAAGMTNDQLMHVRRGALLHDIGKLGVPDHILLKPGRLTDREQAIMHRHPQYAYDMLSSIDYLRPALDIPLCHHERWDGTGYPRGLKGEQIPYAARLFMVVDVYDALQSNRPYHVGWPQARILKHLRAEAGRHFDPQAVELFLRILERDENPAG